MNSLGLIETLWQDIRYGARHCAKVPDSRWLRVLSLALGIGATTAIFSVVYGVLISPYPYARPNEIWAPRIRDLKNPERGGFTLHKMRDYVELKKLPAFSEAMATVSREPSAHRRSGAGEFSSISVTANAFEFLGVPPVLGRTIQPSDIKSPMDSRNP